MDCIIKCMGLDVENEGVWWMGAFVGMCDACVDG